MSSRSRAKAPVRPEVFVLAALVALLFAALACGMPSGVDDLNASGSGGGPFMVCITATPIPTVTYVYETGNTITNTLGTPEPETAVGLTTPVPTETPYYRQGEFWENQPAIFGRTWQVTLLGIDNVDGGSRVRVRLTNNGLSDTPVLMSSNLFVMQGQSAAHYDSNLQAALGMADVAVMESEPIAAGTSVERAYAFAVPQVMKVGVQSGQLTGGSARPIWLNRGLDPATVDPAKQACIHGVASFADSQKVYPMDKAAYRPGISGGRYPLTGEMGKAWVVFTRFGVHHGLDLATTNDAPGGRIGSPIYSPIAGYVELAGTSVDSSGNINGYGNFVVIRAQIGPSDYIWMYFAHMNALPAVSKGQQVHCWDYLGPVGTTGNSTGPHLHWEVRRGRQPFLGDGVTSGRYAATQFDPDASREFWGGTCAWNDLESGGNSGAQ